MRVCLIATEIFDHGNFGGFGALTRTLAEGLARKGVHVTVVTPRNENRKPIEYADGYFIVSFPWASYTLHKGSDAWLAVFRMIDADVYHSQEPSAATVLAMRAMPEKKHVITFQDPRSLEERRKEWIEAGLEGRELKARERKFVRSYKKIVESVRATDALYTQAEYVVPKIQEIYGIRTTPALLPNPVDVPPREMVKAERPSVCYLGRWDPRKRPELFFQLAERFPEVEFTAMGGCQPHFAEREKELRAQYGSLPNLHMPGWTFGEDKSRILESSWILINTSWRECLPVSYVEACTHECAVLSHENPENFASRFGFHAKRGDLEDYCEGLQSLLENDRWRELGMKGRELVENTYENNAVIERHIEIYEQELAR